MLPLGSIRYTSTQPLGTRKSYRLDAVYKNTTCGMSTIQAQHQSETLRRLPFPILRGGPTERHFRLNRLQCWVLGVELAGEEDGCGGTAGGLGILFAFRTGAELGRTGVTEGGIVGHLAASLARNALRRSTSCFSRARTDARSRSSSAARAFPKLTRACSN